MQTTLLALALTLTAALTVPLAVVALGIRRQEHAGSLAARPAGLTAALTRTMLDLHAAPPADTAMPAPSTRQSRP